MLDSFLLAAGRYPYWQPLPRMGRGVDELVDALERHYDHLVASGEMEERERTMAAHRLKTIIQGVALDRIEDPSIGPDFDDAVEDVRLRKRAPFTVALDLLEGSV